MTDKPRVQPITKDWFVSNIHRPLSILEQHLDEIVGFHKHGHVDYQPQEFTIDWQRLYRIHDLLYNATIQMQIVTDPESTYPLPD